MKSSSLMLFAAVFALSLASQAMAQSGSDARPNDPYGYNRFSPSMAIIIAVLIAALFFMGFFSIYIRHCSEGQAAGSVAGGNGAVGRSRRAARGLDAAVIATFPTLEYSAVKGLKIGKGALECAVCLCEFEDDETLRLIPKCDHVFHPECIDTWLESHTTCPVCRANLVPEPGDSVNGTNTQAPPDIENQTNAVEPLAEDRTGCEEELEPARAAPEPEVLEVSKTLNRNRTRGGGSRSRSSGFRRLFPRSHSTGHSLVQPGESTERFTLRLPEEVRKEILDRQLQRASSMVALPREGSSRRGYRTGEGSSRGGRYGRRLDRMTKSDRWVFSMAPPFFARMSSMKSPKVAATDAGEGPSNQTVGPELPRSDSARPPV